MSNLHPVFWVMAAAVLAPLLAELPLRFRVPVVVFEVLLGMLIGPHGLGLVNFEGFIESMFTFGMAATLFMAGMELNFKHIRGMPLFLALRGWGLSLVIGVALSALLYATPLARSPLMLTLALSTTALGTLLPLLRDAGQLHTPFGRLFVAAGTVGEVGPIVTMSLLLSQEYSTWQEFGFLLLFLLLVLAMAAAGMGLRPAPVVALLTRTLHASTATAGTAGAVPDGRLLRADRGVRLREHPRRLCSRHGGRAGHAGQGGQAAAAQDRRRVLRLVHSLLLCGHRREVPSHRHHARLDHCAVGAGVSAGSSVGAGGARVVVWPASGNGRIECPSRCTRRWRRCRWWW